MNFLTFIFSNFFPWLGFTVTGYIFLSVVFKNKIFAGITKIISVYKDKVINYFERYTVDDFDFEEFEETGIPPPEDTKE